MMPDTSWKAFERRMAARLPGASRRGAYTRNGRTGKPDLIFPGWSVECKLLARPTLSSLLSATRQAETNRENPDDIPIAFVKRNGALDDDTIVAMSLATFQKFFIAKESQ